MSTKQILVCDKCGIEAPDPNGMPAGIPMPVTLNPFAPSPMDRNFPTLESSWWRFMTTTYGVALPIDLCPACSTKVLCFIDVKPRTIGDLLQGVQEVPAGALSEDDLKNLGIVEG